MEHTVAISQTLIPILLAIIGFEGAIVVWHSRRLLDKNERDHDELFARTNEHSRRISVVENEVGHLKERN